MFFNISGWIAMTRLKFTKADKIETKLKHFDSHGRINLFITLSPLDLVMLRLSPTIDYLSPKMFDSDYWLHNLKIDCHPNWFLLIHFKILFLVCRSDFTNKFSLLPLPNWCVYVWHCMCVSPPRFARNMYAKCVKIVLLMPEGISVILR